MAASADYLSKMKENLTCPLCYEVYNHKERTPKGLPCYHTLCLQCLDSYVKKNLQENHLCPMCQAKFEVPFGEVTSIPTNTGLKGMIDLLKEKDQKGHNITATDEVNYADSTPLCKWHRNAKCIVMCLNCNSSLCAKCIKSPRHRNHKFEDIHTDTKGLKQDAKALKERFENITRKHNAYFETVSDKLQSIELSVNEKVAERAEKVTNEVQEWQQNVLDKFDKEHSKTIRFVDKLKSDFEKHEVTIKPLLEKIATVSQDNSLDGARMKETLTKKIGLLEITGEKLRRKNIRFTQPTLYENRFPVNAGHLKNNTIQMYYIINDVDSFGKRKLGAAIISQYWYLHKLPWKIVLELRRKSGNLWLAAFVQCDHHTPSWSCMATYEIMLIANKGKPPVTFNERYKFNRNGNGWGKDCFVNWTDLTNPSNGFVTNNSATIMATITADPPTGV